MQPFRLTSFFILILLLGTVLAAACTNDDRASTVAETPPPAAPTPDVEAIVETAVREMLEAIPTPAPAPTPDIEAIVETVLQRTTGILLETLVAGLSVDTETTEDTQLSPEPIPVPARQGEAVEVQALPASGSGEAGRLMAYKQNQRTTSVFLSFGVAGFGALAQRVSILWRCGLRRTAHCTEGQRGWGSHHYSQRLGDSIGGRGLCNRDSRSVLRPRRPRKAITRGPRRCPTEPGGPRHRRG